MSYEFKGLKVQKR